MKNRTFLAYLKVKNLALVARILQMSPIMIMYFLNKGLDASRAQRV